ncbi:MAG: dihydroorotate dehydrogenase electron transfer subunit [Treponema sp.]|nr:dihydroorotate dehydrogenase electron transfer subunit [Treponema sp.]
MKQCRSSELLANTSVAIAPDNIFRLDFAWDGPVPQAGQFFLIKPERSSMFLARPISVMGWDRLTSVVSGTTRPDECADAAVSGTMVLRFLIARHGIGTTELAQLREGERAWLTGPLGNSWWDNDSAKADTPIALIGGGIGIAPLAAFARELDKQGRRIYDFYVGFKSASFGLEDLYPRRLYVATEDGGEGQRGRIPDLLLPQNYKAVYACGPMPMLKVIATLCKATTVPCFVSMEQHMACGVGACLGCTVKVYGTGGVRNRRCCADGPVFNTEELVFDQ